MHAKTGETGFRSFEIFAEPSADGAYADVTGAVAGTGRPRNSHRSSR